MSKSLELKQEAIDLLDTYNFGNIDSDDLEDIKQVVKVLLDIVSETGSSSCNVYGFCNPCAAVKSLHDTIKLLHRETDTPRRARDDEEK